MRTVFSTDHANRPHAEQWRAPLVAATGNGASQFEVRWAACEDEVRDAQRLRHRIFAREMGAILTPPAGTSAGHDADRFDPYCDHLLVYALDRAGERGPLIGTYRVLTPTGARRAGGFYSDTEFDLVPLHPLRAHALELGRACVDANWRNGAVIMALWSALCQYMLRHELDTMIGCASVSLNEGIPYISNLWSFMRIRYMADARWQVRPRVALPLPAKSAAQNAAGGICVPPLIKGYLRCGARVLGPPAFDAAFNTADLPIMLRIDELTPRYRRHFLGA